MLGQDVPGASFTVGRLRLPRAVLAVVAGLCFGLGGVTFQTMLRNPLASPDIIGISSGASAAAAFAIVVLSLGSTAVSVFAIVAGLGVALLVYLLAFKDGVAGTRLILIGIGIAAMLDSVTAYVLSQAGEWDLQEAMRWLTGSLNGTTWAQTLPALVALVVLAPLLLAQTRSLAVMQLGDDTASALGVRVERTRLVVIVAAVGLIAFATAGCRTHRLRRLPVRADRGPHRRPARLPAGARRARRRAAGAGRRLRRPVRLRRPAIPVGVVTGVLGAPYLDLPDHPHQPRRRLAVTARPHPRRRGPARSATATAPSSTPSTWPCRRAGSPPSSAPTPAASPRCCARCRGCSPPAKAGCCWTARRCTALPAKELARTLGLLPQSPIAPEGITVADLVGRGRHPHQGMFSRWTREDDAAVAAALEATQTADLADRPVDELSGGQRQRVWIAMALAQQTDLLLLDEPTTFLDVSHQIEVLDLLTDLNRLRGTTIVMVLHDLNLAARYADHLVALADGRLHAAGDPAEVLTEETVRAVFGLDSRVIVDPTSGRPLMLPIGRHHTAHSEGTNRPVEAAEVHGMS